jgi:hypothetical protein
VSPFVLLPGVTLDSPGSEPFRLHGGHRLWHAPEIPEWTYRPDHQPVEVATLDDGASFTSRDSGTGLWRTIAIRLGDGFAMVDHSIGNQGDGPATLAPWALTMLRLGGEAWVPISQQPTDPNGLMASGSLVLWPYSHLDDPRLSLADDLVRIRAPSDAPGKVKVGAQLRRGWLAYRLGSVLFVKRAAHTWGADYPDLIASAQVYVDDRFIELESLGPRVTLGPGESTTHREQWSLHAVEADADPRSTIDRLALDG